MFKKLYEKLGEVTSTIKKYIQRCYNDHEDMHQDIKNIYYKVDYLPQITRMEATITSQQRTIEQLTNALKDKYEHGLFIFSEDCKIPMVIRNGKEITNDMVSRFSIDWVHGEAPNIEIEQFVGTVSDMEN